MTGSLGRPVHEETTIPLQEAPNHLPRDANGRRVHYSTLFRWRHRGVRGKRLETFTRGGRVYTSLEALARFLESPKQSTRCDLEATVAPASTSVATAERYLDSEGLQ